jgi:hypothetical protein
MIRSAAPARKDRFFALLSELQGIMHHFLFISFKLFLAKTTNGTIWFSATVFSISSTFQAAKGGDGARPLDVNRADPHFGLASATPISF